MSPRAWLRIGAVAWAVLLVAAGIYAARQGRPTVREQTTILRALPVVDRAIAAVVVATPGSRAVVSVSGYERIQSRCAAGNRDGERYQRVATLYSTPGHEGALIDTVAAALPKSFHAGVRHAGASHSLSADAGFFVQLTAATVSPGELRFVADTGCRVPGGAVSGFANEGGPQPAVTVAQAVLDRLGVAETRRQVHPVPCPTGGKLMTVAVTASRSAKPASASVPAGVTPLIAREDLTAFVDGGVGVAIRVRSADLVLTATTGCA